MKTEFIDVSDTQKNLVVEIPSTVVDAEIDKVARDYSRAYLRHVINQEELLGVARRLEGMARHASTHAAGVVIAPGPITDYAPLYKGGRDEIVTQWAMKEIERVGLLKMDFLGLSTLTLIDDALKEIKRTEGIGLDIDGAQALELDAEGTLVMHTAGGDLSQPRPFAYQQIDGVRRPVAADYALDTEGHVRLRLGALLDGAAR